MLTVVPDPAPGDDDRPAGSDSTSLIDQIVREGARRMLAEALQAEVDAYIASFADQRDEHGHRLVVRNGYHQPREVLTSAGAVAVTTPRVNDRRTDPDTGVTVFAVSPGATATEFTTGMGADARVLTAGRLRTPEDVVTTALNHLDRRNPGPAVIDGRFNRLGVLSSRLMSRRGSALTMARVFDPDRLSASQPAR